MSRVNVRKRGNVYEYFFEGAKVNNKRQVTQYFGNSLNFFNGIV